MFMQFSVEHHRSTLGDSIMGQRRCKLFLFDELDRPLTFEVRSFQSSAEARDMALQLMAESPWCHEVEVCFGRSTFAVERPHPQ
jgi:hypothetical protein